jgi:carboxylate-amine ligase
MYLLHALNRYVPHFIALSGSSPFLQGADTSFQSARLNSVFAFPLSGRAPFLLSWNAFAEDYFERMAGTGIVKSMKDFYWDLRPKPEYGTIELRVCDTPLSVERAAALACYLQALCSYLLAGEEPPPREDDYLVYNYNRFQACRFGLDGTLVHPQRHEAVVLRDDILATLRRLEPHFAALGSTGALEQLRRDIHLGSDADYLREAFRQGGSREAVVDAALDRFGEDQTIWS